MTKAEVLEQTGKPGFLHISKATRSLIGNQYTGPIIDSCVDSRDTSFM